MNRHSAIGSRSLTLRELVVIGLGTLCASGAVLSLGVWLDHGWEEGLLCLLATGALAAAMLPLVLRRRFELIEPVSFVVLAVAVGVTAKAFYLCYGPADRVGFLLLGKEPGDLLYAALVIAAGLLCMSVGYLLGRVRWRLPRLARRGPASWEPRQLYAVTGFLVIVGMLSFLLFTFQFNASFAHLSDLSSKRLATVEGSDIVGGLGYLRWGATLIELGFYLVLAHWVASRKRLLSGAGAAMLALALASLLYPFFTSSRMTIMLMVLRAVVVWICIRGEPRPRSVTAVAVLGLLIISPMLAFRRGASDWQSVGEELGVGGVVEATVGGRHFLDLTKTAHILDAVPERIDYQYGATMMTWLVAPIPRELWPDKPAINIGRSLGAELFGSSPGSGVTPGLVGDLYLNFGLPAVLVGLLAFGLLMRSVYTTLRPHFARPGVVLVYALLATRLGHGVLSNSPAGGVTRLLKEMVPLLLALYFLGRRQPAAEAEAEAEADTG